MKICSLLKHTQNKQIIFYKNKKLKKTKHRNVLDQKCHEMYLKKYVQKINKTPSLM